VRSDCRVACMIIVGCWLSYWKVAGLSKPTHAGFQSRDNLGVREVASRTQRCMPLWRRRFNHECTMDHKLRSEYSVTMNHEHRTGRVERRDGNKQRD
jgi:hypothetical protein